MKKLLALIALATSCTLASAQASATATRRADLQLGGSFSYASPDYGADKLHGYGFYGDLDVKYHLGLEVDFHQLSGKDPILYERTYEIGPRFIYPIHDRFVPYIKGMYGRGVFNFPGYVTTSSGTQEVEVANLAYNIYTGGAGLDLKVLPGLNIRVIDFEYQRWGNFPPRGLTPTVFSFGVAYHFHGGDRYGR